MKEPRFRVLADLAVRREEQARLTVGRSERERGERAAQLDELERGRLAAAPTSLAYREVYGHWWRGQEELIRAASSLLVAADAALEKARAELRETHRITLTWAKLRERDAETIHREAERRQAREIDDLTATRSAQR